jgi:hypothetical protein
MSMLATMTGSLGLVTEAQLSLSDVTTANATTSAHGFLKKLDNDTSHFMRGDGAWAVAGSTSPLTTKGDIYTYTSADARLAVGTNGYMLTPDSAQSTGLLWQVPRSLPSRGFERLIDCCGTSATTEFALSPLSSGTGASVGFAFTTGITDGTGAGVGQCDLGTTTTGRSGVSYPGSAANFYLAGGQLIGETRIQVGAVSDGTETYTGWFGIVNASSSVVPTAASHALWLSYTHSVNSAKWVISSANNTGSITSTNTTSAAVAANTWIRLTIIVNAAGTSADFYVDGTNVGTLTGGTFPTPSTGFALVSAIVKSAGTTSVKLFVDYMYLYKEFSSSR